MARSKNGQAIRASRRRGKDLRRLRALLSKASKRGDLKEWRRAKAVLGYLDGKSVVEMASELEVDRSAINRWLRWYEIEGADGLRTQRPPGASPKLDEVQRIELVALIENGPQASGYSTGVWTGPMIRDLIERRFGVSYHNHHVPRLLNSLGFSVQRPRKRLARADAELQAIWLRKRLPAIKKKPPLVEA